VSEPAHTGTGEVISLGNGCYRIDDGERRRVAFAVAAQDTWVFLDGRVYVVSPATGSVARRSGVDDRGALTSPMPATVLAIHVEPGQRVTRDEVLMVLEAMKMELPVRAPRDGRITKVACRPGELVQAGVTLLEIED